MTIPNGYYVSERPPVLNLTETSPCPKRKSSSRVIVLGFETREIHLDPCISQKYILPCLPTLRVNVLI